MLILRIIFTATGLLLLAGQAGAHELFIKPQAYRLAAGAPAVAALFNGTFDKSENIIARSRMLDVTIHGGGMTRHPDASQWQDKGAETHLSFAAGAPGTYALGVSTKARFITLSAADFADYLRHEGVLDALRDFEASGSTEAVRERYSKHVRSILQVGEIGSGDYRQAFGYPVEIVLEDNPYTAAAGDRLAFTVLRSGKPLAEQIVYASYEGYHADEGAESAKGAEGADDRAVALRTDAAGRAEFVVTQPGIWYLSLIHMQKLEGDPLADYESNWSTLTFEID